mmetsp:Transcript_48503/g.58525  ORF Transcript_48503/g.58525 Transcript_48503/m.58525 type:complete len:819 (-) Transcript_48503:67-2523(-)
MRSSRNNAVSGLPRRGLSRIDSVAQSPADAEEHARQQEIGQLHILCDTAEEGDEESWEAVREWIRAHSRDQEMLLAGAQRQGEFSTTPLHYVCRNCPPVDVVQALLHIAPHTVEWTDSFSWLPLHYACANGASEEVLRMLAEAYPLSKTANDRRGRTPLHFALGNVQRPISAASVYVLSSTGAAACHDENGMLPLHYACAYGTSEEALKVLTDASPGSVKDTDNKGRTPLHFALGNADRSTSPAAVRLLLAEFREVVDFTDADGQLPLHLLATQASRLSNDQKKERRNAEKCLELYLASQPKATADFLTALQSLPEWLRDCAVVAPLVQDTLNDKISKRFPTMILLLDAYFLVIIIFSFRKASFEAVNWHYANEPTGKFFYPNLWFLFLGGLYFLIREVVQVASLLSLGLGKTWLFDPTNALDVTCILLAFFWFYIMFRIESAEVTGAQHEWIRTGIACSTAVFWMAFLSYLKSTLIDFAVFVGGVIYVVRRLGAFIVALVVILVAFAQMFLTVFQQTSYCDCRCNHGENYGECTLRLDTLDMCSDKIESYELEHAPFCTLSDSLMKVYTMLLGEVDDQDFKESLVAKWLFVMFMFLVVILLANVLIAIVTDSYGVIRNQRAAIVFWSNRLDFVAEMDAMTSGPWKKKVKSILSFGDAPDGSTVDLSEGDVFGRSGWKHLIELYDDEDLSPVSFEFWCYLVARVVTGVFIIPSWFLVGVLSAGWLWPPQMREYFLKQQASKHMHGDTLAEKRLFQLMEISNGVRNIQDEMKVEMNSDRQEVEDMKRQLVQMKSEVVSEMREIKDIMTTLFDTMPPQSE